jgi:ABC-type methionine transport system ATPase subunit
MAWWRRSAPSHEDPHAACLPLIRLEGISKVFQGEAEEPAVALRDVTLDIGRGICVGLCRPAAGSDVSLHPRVARYARQECWLSGRDTAQLSPAERARTRIDIGLVFQASI